MRRAIRDVARTVQEFVLASVLLAVAIVVGLALILVGGPLYLLGFSEQTAGYAAATVVGVAGVGAIVYGGYTMIEWP